MTGSKWVDHVLAEPHRWWSAPELARALGGWWNTAKKHLDSAVDAGLLVARMHLGGDGHGGPRKRREYHAPEAGLDARDLDERKPEGSPRRVTEGMRERVLEAARAKPGSTVGELVRVTGFSWATVYMTMRGEFEQGRAERVEVVGRGRSATRTSHAYTIKELGPGPR